MGRNLGPLNIKDSYEGLVQISGSQLTDGSGSLIPSLDIAASTATSASHAVIADTATSASHALNADNAVSSSFAISSSADDLTLQQVTDNGANTTNTIVVSGRNYASSGISSNTAGGTYTVSGGTSAAQLLLVGNNNSNINSITLNPNGTDDNIFIQGNTKIDDNLYVVGAITASIGQFDTLTATSASIGYLQQITGSAKIIGDAFIILNNDTPTERYAGLVVQDSGSGSPLTTSSLQYDGQTDDWFYEYSTDGGVTTDHGIAMFGPEYNTKGSPVYNTANTLVKGDGGHHLEDSSITDDGTLVTINANVSASGYVSASTFIGDGSQLSGISTTPFPFTGSAEISGSLRVQGITEGQIVTGHPDNIATGVRSAVIGGGNAGGADANEATGFESTVVGGHNNKSTSEYTFIGGGKDNAASGFYTSVMGGRNAAATGQFATVIGGASNTAGGQSSGVFVGQSNTIGSNGTYSAIVGGLSNTNDGAYGVILGGSGHAIASGQDRNVLLGGQENDITSGDASGILAGYLNDIQATTAAVVGGRNNTAQHQDSVVLGGDGLSTTKTQEAVVNHLSIYGDAIVDDGVTTGNVIDNIGQTVVSVEDAVQHIVHCTQAEYDAITPDANTLYVIEGAETLGDTNVDGKLTGTVNTISDSGGTTALDCSVGNYFTLAMPAGGSTVLTPSNITAGQTINIKITQNATAATLTYAASIDFPGGTAFTISTGSGEVDVLTLVSFDGTTLQATGLANFS